MLNLVASDCIGGRYFQAKGVDYQNPFIWNSLLLSNFLTLIREWNTINLKKLDSYISNDEYGNTRNVPTLLVDDKIKAFFHHHHQDDKCLQPTKTKKDIDDIDLSYCKIEEYLKDCWIRRVDRIQGEPVFCYNDKPFSTDTDMMEFVNIEVPTKKILITCKKEYKKYENDKLSVHIKPKEIMNSIILCNDLLKAGILY